MIIVFDMEVFCVCLGVIKGSKLNSFFIMCKFLRDESIFENKCKFKKNSDLGKF